MSDLSMGRHGQLRARTARARLDARHVGHEDARALSRASRRERRLPGWQGDARIAAVGLTLSMLVVAAMVLGSSIVTLAASAIALAAAVISPLTGMIPLAFTASLPRPLVLPAPGLYVAMIGSILLGVVLRLPIERPSLSRPPLSVLLLAGFLVYLSAHFVAGLVDGYAGSRSTDIVSLFAATATGILAFIASSIVLRGQSPYPVIAALLLSAALVSGTVLAQSVGVEALFGNLIGASAAADRMTGPFGDPNYAGAYLAASASLAVAIGVIARTTWVRVSVIGLAGVVVAALLLTESRGGLVALAAGLFAIAITRGRRAVLLVVTAVLVLLPFAYPVFVEMRFGPDSAVAGRDLAAQLENSDRILPWLAGGEVFLSSPLFGVGFGRMVEESGLEIEAHNWYVSVLGEVGLAGIVLWVLFIIAVVVTLWRSTPSARTVGFSVLVAWMIASMFIEVPRAYASTGPVLIALAAAIWADWSPAGRGGAALTRGSWRLGRLARPPRRARRGAISTQLDDGR